MGADQLAVAVSFCILAVTVAGFILSGIKSSLSSLWEKFHREVERTSDFREDVKSNYMTKVDVENHLSIRLDNMNERMKRLEAQLEVLQPVMAGLNQSLPAIAELISSLEKQVNRNQNSKGDH